MENQPQSSFSVLMVGLPYLEGVDLLPYIQSLVIFITLALLFKLFHKLVLVRLKKLSNETKTSIDNMVVDTLGKIKSWVYTYVAFYVALLPLSKPDLLHTILTAGLLILVVWQLIELATCFINYGINFFLQKDRAGDERGGSGLANTAGVITLLTRLVLWSFGGLFILSNLGVDVTSLIAGFGVSGIAVALALKSIFKTCLARCQFTLINRFKLVTILQPEKIPV